MNIGRQNPIVATEIELRTFQRQIARKPPASKRLVSRIGGAVVIDRAAQLGGVAARINAAAAAGYGS